MRVYLPYGNEWYGYMMRRLAERPANLVFFARALTNRCNPDSPERLIPRSGGRPYCPPRDGWGDGAGRAGGGPCGRPSAWSPR